MATGLKKGFVQTGNNAFNYLARGDVKAGEEYILPLPKVSANKRGVNDIGWQIDGEARLYATLSDHPEREDAIWQEIHADEDVNKTAAAVKIVGTAAVSHVCIRIILN